MRDFAATFAQNGTVVGEPAPQSTLNCRIGSSDPAPLPAWPTPSVHRLDAEEDGARLLDALRSDPPSALGVDVVVSEAGDLQAVAIASSSEHVDLIVGDAIDDETGQALCALPSYLVFAHAQPALHALGQAPARFGCLRTGAVLLAAGRNDRRDASLPALVQRVLKRQLDAPFESPLGQASRRASTLLPLMSELTSALRKRTNVELFSMECELVPAVVDMEQAGIAVDAHKLESLVAEWNSERQSASDGAIEESRIRRLDKLLSTYGRWGQDFVFEGRIHTNLHPLAADSGRFSSTDPNLQQVPAEHTAPGFRSAFRAPEGKTLVVADYAQIELRVAAQLAPCDALRSVFEQGRDVHRATAATLTGKAEADVTSVERKLAKAINFGFLFGMGARRFASYASDSFGIELSMEEAQRARAAFFKTFPGVAAWHKRTAALERQQGPRGIAVATVMGRRKQFAPGRFSFNAALNIPVQGTAAEGMKLAMIELHRKLPQLGARGVLCVHDEYIAEVDLAQAEPARAMVEREMIEGMRRVVPDVPIEVDAQIQSHW